MTKTAPNYSLPRSTIIRWLVMPKADVPSEIAVGIVSGIFTDLAPYVIGALVSLSITLAAAVRHPGPLFFTLLTFELTLVAGRLSFLEFARRLASQGRKTPTDLLFASGLVWTTLIGVNTAVCVWTRDPVLQMLAPTCMMGILGGLVTRNYGAPRLVLLQIALCDLPFNCVIPFAGDAWLLLSCAQCPLFLIAMRTAVDRLNRTYLSAVLAERQSELRATHDGLTGLWNRSGFMAALGRALRPGHERPTLSLFYIDLDGFKTVNDNNGHSAGDTLLRRVADRLSLSIPDAAICGRLGGDEFVVLLPECGASDAASIGLQVIAALSQPYDLDDGVKVRVGASIGIAVATQATTPETLLAQADTALYAAKADGKGRCVMAGQSSSTAAEAARAA